MKFPLVSHVVEDARIVQRAKNGCAEAFALLVQKHHLSVRMFLARQIQDPSVIDDLAQEVFLGAVRGISDLENDSGVERWLLAIARHKLVDHLRSKKRNSMLTGLGNPASTENVDTGWLPAADDRADRCELELVVALQDCISVLQPNARQLVRQFYFQNESAEEIARRSNRNGNSVRMALHRIRAKLAQCIRNKLGTEF
jgi:RNA polymerase sigma-70 factor (ECF subfamily)